MHVRVFLSARVIAASSASSSAFSFSSLFDGDEKESSASGGASSSTSDITERPDGTFQQPLLDAEDWFLSKQEITASRGGVPRTDLSVYTTGNKVTSYTASNEFYSAVYDDLSATKEGDHVMLAAWLTALVPLKPDVDPTGAKTGIKEVFAGVVERGGNVSVLNWASIAGGYIPFNIKARDAINSIPPSKSTGARATFLFDDRVNMIASHHQKTLVIASSRSLGKTDQPVATAIRDGGGITYKNKGWVDGHIRIHGPTAKDQSVQITRTFNCEYKHYKEFAPKGENSLFHARIKAIKNAKNFIYIEDQYFVLVPELLDALMEVMPRIQRVIVVTKEQTNAFTNGGYPDKFEIYTTKADRKLLIHSKIVIIDDVYLSIGSANWNRRSMTADSELNADVVDTDTVKSPDGVMVGKLPRDFRVRKFSEMTGLSYKKITTMTFTKAADQFAIAAAKKSTIIAPLKSEHHAYFIAITDAKRKIADPQYTCIATSS
ncbi:phospholipase D-like protein [Phytophthora sojae]|uniref:phospholipase D n=1 Tax=Phytophthora sojae (strain P6497) TaxID=1094619 RepID=G4YYR5_PHYSP|nr:phospholipase D-like protein [Phytophthora sojae]EGZ25743.1 phospholipase D-like protein [Phytophthora sojae]|eukprot:XP_009521031.1 phospholipase D-like protein [Phytophthora sojae]